MEKERSWKEAGATRRFFVRLSLLVTAAAAVSGMTYPLLRYLFPGRSDEKTKKETFQLALNEIHAGEARFFKFKQKAAILIRKSEKEVVALSAVCTHLGCIIKFSEAEMILNCPCHGGKFDLHGKVTGGPPPTPLEVYSASIEGGKITVQEA